MRVSCLCALAAGSWSLALLADSVSLTTARDNTLYEDATGALSGGADDHFFTGINGESGGYRKLRGMLFFDIAGDVPAGATITGVSLTLTQDKTDSGGTVVNLHRALRPWGEGTSVPVGGGGGGAQGGPSTPGSATWQHTFYATNFWSNPGGDYAASPSAGQTVLGNGAYIWTATSMIQDVQAWLDNPATNFGWIAIGDETQTAKRYSSREHATSASRPELTIDFTVTSTTWPDIVSVTLMPQGIETGWTSVSGTIYQLQSATNLTVSPPVWLDVGGATTSHGAIVSAIDTNFIATPRFYRVLGP